MENKQNKPIESKSIPKTLSKFASTRVDDNPAAKLNPRT